MNTLTEYVRTAQKVGELTEYIQAYLDNQNTNFPTEEVRALLEFTSSGILADSGWYPQFMPLYEQGLADTDSFSAIQALLCDKDNELLRGLLSAVTDEFDKDLKRPEFWVASCFILKGQRMLSPDLCSTIAEAFRCVMSGGEDAIGTLHIWLLNLVSPIL